MTFSERMERFHAWRKQRVRTFERGRFHVTITPHPVLSIPLRNGRRLRAGSMHGVQVVAWMRGRWTVTRQIAGKSRVIGEQFKEA